jgi:predicted NBD/HSP70 family sugar kinase
VGVFDIKAVQNVDGIQKVNRCTVLKLMLDRNKISRADIARMTGLHKATVTNIINEFSDMGIVSDCGQIVSANGRKTAGLTLNLESVVVIAVRINRGTIDFGVCNMMGETTDRSQLSFRIDEKIEKILDLIRQGITQMMALAGTRKILCISIAILGPMVRNKHKIAKVYDMPELGKVDVEEEVSKMFPGAKVFLDHDANMSTFAEWKSYKVETGKTKGVMLNLDFGVGIGGGIMIDGKLFRGSNGIAGEVGHMGIDFHANDAGYMNFKGIFESYASPWVIKRDALNRLFEFQNSKITEDSSLEEIYGLYEKGDELAVWAVNRMCWFLAYGLSSIIYLINPDVVVLGDEIIRSQKFLMQLKQDMKKFLPGDLVDALDIRFSKFKHGGMLLGATMMAVDHYIESLEILDFLKDKFPLKDKKSNQFCTE